MNYSWQKDIETSSFSPSMKLDSALLLLKRSGNLPLLLISTATFEALPRWFLSLSKQESDPMEQFLTYKSTKDGAILIVNILPSPQFVFIANIILYKPDWIRVEGQVILTEDKLYIV